MSKSKHTSGPLKEQKTWTCPRCGYCNSDSNEVCMGAEMGDGRCGELKPKEDE